MKKIIVMALMAVLVATILVGSVMSGQQAIPGPAPNSSDGIPDGSGWDDNHWPEAGKGPAPNSGDGVSDGSGF